jgi:hypothetical protein
VDLESGVVSDGVSKTQWWLSLLRSHRTEGDPQNTGP